MMDRANYLDRLSARFRKRRGRRALERQLAYQENKAVQLHGNEQAATISIIQRSNLIREKLHKIQPIPANARVLEVGCGAHGLIFGFGNAFGVGIDPLAVEYKRLFPVWQKNANTVSAIGENLPFDTASFDIVLSDNVVDHAENPVAIIHELSRVLRPGGLLYFTVNVHHPIYQFASNLHGIWNGLGIRYELSPFADHTVHFTEPWIKEVFAELPFEVVEQSSTVDQVRSANRKFVGKGLESRFKKVFFKNALFELTAVRRGTSPATNNDLRITPKKD